MIYVIRSAEKNQMRWSENIQLVKINIPVKAVPNKIRVDNIISVFKLFYFRNYSAPHPKNLIGLT